MLIQLEYVFLVMPVEMSDSRGQLTDCALVWTDSKRPAKWCNAGGTVWHSTCFCRRGCDRKIMMMIYVSMTGCFALESGG